MGRRSSGTPASLAANLRASSSARRASGGLMKPTSEGWRESGSASADAPMTSSSAALICAASRTRFARAWKGRLAGARPDDLLAALFRSLLGRLPAGARDQVDEVVVGGVESMSRIPIGGIKPSPNPALLERRPELYLAMGETAERVARRFNI